MPRVLFASSLCFGVMGAVVDCEVKGVNIGAGRTCLCVVVDVYSSFSIRVSVPDVLLASSCLERCIVMLRDDEEYCVSAGTTVSVRVVVGISSSRGVSLFVP